MFNLVGPIRLSLSLSPLSSLSLLFAIFNCSCADNAQQLAAPHENALSDLLTEFKGLINSGGLKEGSNAAIGWALMKGCKVITHLIQNGMDDQRFGCPGFTQFVTKICDQKIVGQNAKALSVPNLNFGISDTELRSLQQAMVMHGKRILAQMKQIEVEISKKLVPNEQRNAKQWKTFSEMNAMLSKLFTEMSNVSQGNGLNPTNELAKKLAENGTSMGDGANVVLTISDMLPLLINKLDYNHSSLDGNNGNDDKKITKISPKFANLNAKAKNGNTPNGSVVARHRPRPPHHHQRRRRAKRNYFIRAIERYLLLMAFCVICYCNQESNEMMTFAFICFTLALFLP